MLKINDADIIICKCQTHKTSYGMRIDRNGRDWIATWSFPINDRTARREGYADNTVQGVIYVTDAFPGCPSCGGKNYVVCGNCNRLSCWDGRTMKFHCGWCGTRGNISGTYDGKGVKSAGDR